MLNKNNERELAYIVAIDEIRPIPNYDRVEHARVGGWWVVVKKDQFKVGDPAIYIEVDSRVPEKEPFMFLEKKHFKVKTQKMCKVLSQGLLMAAEDFGWTKETSYVEGCVAVKDNEGNFHNTANESMFVTKLLEITYATEEDNKRKASPVDKYKKMAQRRPDIFKQPWARWMMKHEWGKKIMFLFFGKKKDKKGGWPSWVKKTDEERCQNMPWLFPGNDEFWFATEKVDGTSTTFTLKRGKRGKNEFIVCSRNVAFETPDKDCYYDNNVYWEMAQKYNAKEVLEQLLARSETLDFVTIQGETYGEGIQKRTYGIKGHDFKAFNLIFGWKDGTVMRLDPREMKCVLDKLGVPTVDIVDSNFKIPETCEELLKIATGPSMIDGGMREGLVFRDRNGEKSFKAVSNEFLLKYHQ